VHGAVGTQREAMDERLARLRGAHRQGDDFTAGE
jgi:hypothetical protein